MMRMYFFFILKPDFASRRSFFAGRLLLVPLLFRYLTLASRFLYLYFAARCLVLSVAAPYSLYSAHRTCSCSLVVDRWADSSTLFSDWCSSLRAILRSCRHTLFPADSLHSPIASFRSFLLATSFYLLQFDSSLLVGPFLLLSVIYWPPAFRCLFLVSRCLFIFIISRRPNCMLLVNPKLANHISPFACGCCLSSPADRWTQLGTVPRYSLRDTRFLPITPPHSVAAGSSIFDQYCSLPTGHSSLVASNIMFFITRSSLKMPAILYIFITVFNFDDFKIPCTCKRLPDNLKMK